MLVGVKLWGKNYRREGEEIYLFEMAVSIIYKAL
jgi:hypothetical protein